MATITKPELERGNYICYADEPDTIVDDSGGGGGAVQVLNAHYDSSEEIYVLDTEITFNELKTAFDGGTTVHLKLTKETNTSTQVDVCQMVAWGCSVNESNPSYQASFMFQGSGFMLSAESPDSSMVIL